MPKKLDKIWIRDWGTVEKVLQKLEKLILSNICWNFEKKLEEYSEKLWGHFKITERMFKKLGKLWMNLRKLYKYKKLKILYLPVRKFLECLIIWWNSSRCQTILTNFDKFW